MKYWLKPANINEYDLFNAFKDLKEIDWASRNKFEVGDIVYIYCSLPLQRISHKCEVVAINIDEDNAIDDSKYSKVKSFNKSYKCVRLKLINEINNTVKLKDIDFKSCRSTRTMTIDQAIIIDKMS